MQMHNPPHPGTFIEGVYLEPCALSFHRAATGGWQKSRVARDGTAVVAGAGAQRRKLAGDARQLRPVAPGSLLTCLA
jgi:hypothetical protein